MARTDAFLACNGARRVGAHIVNAECCVKVGTRILIAHAGIARERAVVVTGRSVRENIISWAVWVYASTVGVALAGEGKVSTSAQGSSW